MSPSTVARLGHHERQREPAKAARRRVSEARRRRLVAQTEGGGVEGSGGSGVGHFEGDGFDGWSCRVLYAGHGSSCLVVVATTQEP